MIRTGVRLLFLVDRPFSKVEIANKACMLLEELPRACSQLVEVWETL